MPCEQLPFVRRLIVDDPAALVTPRWKSHLQDCAECREDHRALERALAVFHHFESQPAAQPRGPSWERLSAALAQDARRGRWQRRIRVPMAAAGFMVILASGVLMFPAQETGERVAAPQSRAGVERPGRAPVVTTVAPAANAAGARAVLERTLREVVPVLTPQPRRSTGMVSATPVGQASPASAAAAPGAAEEATAQASAQDAPTPHPSTVATRTRTRQQAPARPTTVLRVRAQSQQRAPVLLFRTLQQRRSLRAPDSVRRHLTPQATPVSAPRR